MREAGRRWAKTCDAGFSYRVADAEHQRHLGPDDDQVSGSVNGQFGHFVNGSDVNRVLFGHCGGAGVSRCDDEAIHFGIATERRQQRMFAGTGSDN